MTVQLKLPKSAGLRGCCQIPAAAARVCLSVWLSRLDSAAAFRQGDAAVFQKYWRKSCKTQWEEVCGGGECENTQADAKPSFHSHANTFTRFQLCQCTMWLSGYKSCSIHVQNGVETAFWHSSMLVSIAHPPLTHRRPSNVRSGQMCLLPWHGPYLISFLPLCVLPRTSSVCLDLWIPACQIYFGDSDWIMNDKVERNSNFAWNNLNMLR